VLIVIVKAINSQP